MTARSALRTARAAKGRSWEPSSAASNADRAALVARLRAGLVEILKRASPEHVATVRAAGDEDLLHPDFFDWYFAFQGAIASENVERFSACIEQLDAALAAGRKSRRRAAANRRELTLPLDLDGRPDSETVERALESAVEMGGPRNPLSVVRVWPRRQRACLAAALHLIADLWPEMHAEIGAFVRQVTLFRGDNVIESFSDFVRHGAIFLHINEFTDEVRIAEFVVHESSHVRLNTAHSVTPLLIESRRRYRTPLRSDPRPLLGAYHQMFVLMRIHQLYLRLAARGSAKWERTLETRRALLEAFQLVRSRAQLTPDGEAVVASIGRFLNC